MNRKKFLKYLLGTSAFLGMPIKNYSFNQSEVQDIINQSTVDINGSMFGFQCNSIQKVRIGIIGLGNRGNTLLAMLEYLVQNDMAEIVALSDISKEKVVKANEKLNRFQNQNATLYYKSNEEWKELSKRDDIEFSSALGVWIGPTSSTEFF